MDLRTIGMGKTPCAAGQEGSTRGLKNCHASVIYRSQSEQVETYVPYMLSGLARNEKGLYLISSSEKDDILEALMKATDLDQRTIERSVTFLTSDETYLRGGAFDKERMLNLIARAEQEAIRDGYSGLRATGEMAWASSSPPGADALIEYEARINYLYPEIKANILCQYCESDFDSSTLVGVLRTHPRVVIGGTMCVNPHYVCPDGMLDLLRGMVPKVFYEQICRDVVKREELLEIHEMERRDLRRANKYVSLVDEFVLDEIQSELTAAEFILELALDACNDRISREHMLDLAERHSRMQRWLHSVRACREMCLAGPRWKRLDMTINNASNEAGIPVVGNGLSAWEVLANDVLDEALARVFESIGRRCGKDSPARISIENHPDGLILTLKGKGTGKPYGSSSDGGMEEAEMRLVREILASTDISMDDTCGSGHEVMFVIHFPRRRVRGTG